jgi:hypothetical protein
MAPQPSTLNPDPLNSVLHFALEITGNKKTRFVHDARSGFLLANGRADRMGRPAPQKATFTRRFVEHRAQALTA